MVGCPGCGWSGFLERVLAISHLGESEKDLQNSRHASWEGPEIVHACRRWSAALVVDGLSSRMIVSDKPVAREWKEAIQLESCIEGRSSTTLRRHCSGVAEMWV